MTRNRIVVLPLVEEEDTVEGVHHIDGSQKIYERWFMQYADVILHRKMSDKRLKITPQMFGHNGEKKHWTTTVQYNIKSVIYAAEIPFEVSTVGKKDDKGEVDFKASYVTIYRVKAFDENSFGQTHHRKGTYEDMRIRLKAWIEKEFPGIYAKFAKEAGKEPAIDPSAISDADFKDIKNEKPAEGEPESGVYQKAPAAFLNEPGEQEGQ